MGWFTLYWYGTVIAITYHVPIIRRYIVTSNYFDDLNEYTILDHILQILCAKLYYMCALLRVFLEILKWIETIWQELWCCKNDVTRFVVLVKSNYVARESRVGMEVGREGNKDFKRARRQQYDFLNVTILIRNWI